MDRVKTRKIYPPTQFFIILITQIIVSYLLSVIKIMPNPANYFGIILVIFGIIINIWADNIFKKSGTTVKPDEIPAKLIDTGPFRLSRHPMYQGMAMILLGTAVWFGSLAAFIFPVIFFLIIHYKYIPPEEKKMEEEFGQLYLDYKKKVRKWI